MITNFSVGGFCKDMQPSLNSSSPTSRYRVVAIICRLSHITRLPATASNTGTLRSSIRIASPHPSRAAGACHTTGPRMTWQTPDIVTAVCQHPAQCKQRGSKRRARQKRNDKDSQEKFYTCQHQPISQHDVKQAQKITDEAFGGGRPLPPPWLRQWGAELIRCCLREARS